MLKKICLLLVVGQLFLIPLYAQEYNPLRKLARGVVNATLGAVEIPKQMVKVKMENEGISGDIAGLFWGPLKGIACFAGRTLLGVYEVATFLIPTYKPLVEPEFILGEEHPEEIE